MGIHGEPRGSRRGSTSPLPVQQAAPPSPQPTSGSVLEMNDWADEVPVDNLSQRLTSLSTESLPLAAQSRGRQAQPLASDSDVSPPTQALLIDEGQDLVPVRNAKGKWTVTRSQQTDRLLRRKSLRHHGRREPAPGQHMQTLLGPAQLPREAPGPL